MHALHRATIVRYDIYGATVGATYLEQPNYSVAHGRIFYLGEVADVDGEFREVVPPYARVEQLADYTEDVFARVARQSRAHGVSNLRRGGSNLRRGGVVRVALVVGKHTGASRCGVRESENEGHHDKRKQRHAVFRHGDITAIVRQGLKILFSGFEGSSFISLSRTAGPSSVASHSSWPFWFEGRETSELFF